MYASRKLQRRCLKSLSPLLQSSVLRNAVLLKGDAPKQSSSNVGQPSLNLESIFPLSLPLDSLFYSPNAWARGMSTSRGDIRSRGNSMRSKVEMRMRKESGKTLREVRRAQKLKKKLMTEEERLIYNLKRARKKSSLLLQKLKKYELPELPTPVHDPELFTLEQIQAYKKIGFKNKNYVPVGVRGVFGGVVQNMHMHWKFHETVQVCCDNFPKEKIKEMATMIARLSGGIVINIHNVKTIIMYRGRNYRQPKNLIPFNTLTKRKALFKARFEQALESQMLNIKKLEQQLRRMGVNPEDPVAMASIQRVASTFFNAIDQKEGSPYVFHGDKQPTFDLRDRIEESEPQADSDQEELDRFISEIEDAADKEWAAEEEAEKEEYGRIRYWNRGEFGGRMRHGNGDSDDEIGRERHWEERRERRRYDDRVDGRDFSDSHNERDFNDARHFNDFDSHSKARRSDDRPGSSERGQNRNSRENDTEIRRNTVAEVRRKVVEGSPETDELLSDLDNAMWGSESEEEENLPKSQAMANFRSSSDEEDTHPVRKKGAVKARDSGSSSDDDVKLRNDFGISVRPIDRNNVVRSARKMAEEDSGTEDEFGDPDMASKSEEEEYDYRETSEYNDDYDLKRIGKHEWKQRRTNNAPKDADECFDSE